MRPNEGMGFGNFIRKIEKTEPELRTERESHRALTKMYKALVEGDEWPTKVMVEAFSWSDMLDAIGEHRSEVSRFSVMTYEDPRNDAENLMMLRRVAKHFVHARQDLRGCRFTEELIDLFVEYHMMTSSLDWTLPSGPSGIRPMYTLEEADEVHS